MLTIIFRYRSSGQKIEFVSALYRPSAAVSVIDSINNVKYSVIEDSRGRTPNAGADHNLTRDVPYVDPGKSALGWCQVPAPPPGVQAVTVSIPGAPPFDNVQISEDGGPPPGRPTPLEEPGVWEGTTVVLNSVERDGATLHLSYSYKNSSDQNTGAFEMLNKSAVYCTGGPANQKFPIVLDGTRARFTLETWGLEPQTTRSVFAAVQAPPREVHQVTVHVPSGPSFPNVAIQEVTETVLPRERLTEWGGCTVKLNSVRRDGATLTVSYTYKNPTDKYAGNMAIMNVDGIFCVDPKTNIRYSVISDEGKARVSGLDSSFLEKGSTRTVSATLQAPPAGVRKVTVHLPCAEAFLLVPIQE
jgi:hypothetical protein